MAELSRRNGNAVRRANQVIRSRTTKLMVLVGVVTFALVFFRLYQLQILRHDELQEQAVQQQTMSTVVSASRGTIYDRTGKRLAVSATAETVFISPAEIEEFERSQDQKIKEGTLSPESRRDRAYIARGLANILDVEEEFVLEEMEKTYSEYQILKRKAEQSVADQVRRFINGQIDDHGQELTTVNEKGETVPVKHPVKIRGIYLEADSKRYYPNNDLAAHVVGFVNRENKGTYGLEAVYESELEGSAGYTVTAKNAVNTPLLFQYEQYYDARNGDDLVLTLDMTVQSYLEKGLASMLEKYDAKNGGAGIVMDVNSGALLGMASSPDYDLNDAWAVQDKKLNETLKDLDPDSEEYDKAKGDAQMRQWRNKCVNDTYEPGSTFKPITLAAALEEGAVDMNTTFNCPGYIMVPGWHKPIRCSNKHGHGHQSLKQAVANSCNPAFVTMAQRLGTNTYYDYLEAFGLMEPTGIELAGEATSLFASRKDFNSNQVSLATYSFGQTFNITPLQLIRAQAACINGGYLYNAHVVDQIRDDQGNVIAQHDNTPVRQVISEETSAKVRECLEYVVSSGTGRNGQVVGYRVGGKTGTADKTGSKDRELVVSFMCFAPADDPQYILLLTMDTPSRTTGTYPSGGNMVAPTAGRIMGEILPYLGVEPDYSAEEMAVADANVPNVVGMSVQDAAAKLGAVGFQYKTVGKGSTVTDQTPVGGSIVPNDARIILYLGEKKSDALCTVPNVVGMTAANANSALTNAGLVMKVAGDAGGGNVKAVYQSQPEGRKLEAGSVITVQFGGQSAGAD